MWEGAFRRFVDLVIKIICLREFFGFHLIEFRPRTYSLTLSYLNKFTLNFDIFVFSMVFPHVMLIIRIFKSISMGCDSSLVGPADPCFPLSAHSHPPTKCRVSTWGGCDVGGTGFTSSFPPARGSAACPAPGVVWNRWGHPHLRNPYFSFKEEIRFSQWTTIRVVCWLPVNSCHTSRWARPPLGCV